MATYTSPAAARSPASHGMAAAVHALWAEVTVTAALTTDDVFEFGYLPENARVIGGYLEASDMDTNGTPTLAINVGDADDADRYWAASTVGQAGTASNDVAVAGLGYKTTAKTLVTGAPSTNAATGVAGTLTACLLYVVE